MLERQPIQARQILKKLIADRLIFDPFEDETGVGYRIRGQATYGRLLDGVISVVPPEGFARLAQSPIEILIAA